MDDEYLNLEAEEDDDTVSMDEGGEQEVAVSDDGELEEEQQFDITLPTAHSYIGRELEPVSGDEVVREGWVGRVPLMVRDSVVFPGETLPLLDAEAVAVARIFAVIASGTKMGVLCEVFEAGGELSAAKARALCRVRVLEPEIPPRLVDNENDPFSMLTWRTRNIRYGTVMVLPERASDPLATARTGSLDALRCNDRGRARSLRRMAAALTPWPMLVYDLLDFERLKGHLHNFFATHKLGSSMPQEAVALSFWAGANLPLVAAERRALLDADDALLRLLMEIRIIRTNQALCCGSCGAAVGHCADLLAMSSDGLYANYINPGGHTHGVLTLSACAGAALAGPSSTAFSWFPGYAWTVAICAACRTHVGWRFTATKRNLRPQEFYGLSCAQVQPQAT